jgi:hypothetical protein
MNLTTDQERAIQDLSSKHAGHTIRLTPRPPMGELSVLADVLPENGCDDSRHLKRYRILANGSTFGVAE